MKEVIPVAKINYQLMLDKIIDNECAERRPSLMLHACCAPCSSYVLEYLASYFRITLFFFNPNIDNGEEYKKRADELIRLVEAMGLSHEVDIIIAPHEPESFFNVSRGLEDAPERGPRCEKCFHLRLGKTAELAAEKGFDYFCTTLSISPHKNAQLLNSTGNELGEKYGVPFLPSDFKKKEGFKRSTLLSQEYSLYRQDYCGCSFSKR